MNTQLMASFIISGLIKPIILLLVISALWWLLRKRSASLQHFVLSLGVISVLLLGVLTIGLSDGSISLFPAFASVFQLPVSWLDAMNSWLGNHSSMHEFLILTAIYFLPASTLIFYLLLGIGGLWWQTRQAEPVKSPELIAQLNALSELVGIQRPIKLVIDREINSPQTWGLFHPVIMLPRAALVWDEDKQISALIHELGHIARWDWLTLLLVKITCACFWFLAPIWWVARQIYQQAEIACDDYIFKLRDKHVVYAKNLLAIADTNESINSSESLHMRGQSPIYWRIMALLDQQRSHQPVAMETAQYWVICSVFLLVFWASVQLLPLQEQLRQRSDFLLEIQWPEIAEKKLVDDDKAVVVETFSWELLQRIKPVLQEYPHWDERLETTRVTVSKPTKQEFSSGLSVEQVRPDIPRIQIQGYLPVDLVSPEYPAVALQKGIEGWVQVEFSIGTEGEIIEPRIIAHSPSAIFDRNVLGAIKKSRYRPQIIDGQAVIVQGVTETYHFQLIPASSFSRR